MWCSVYTNTEQDTPGVGWYTLVVVGCIFVGLYESLELCGIHFSSYVEYTSISMVYHQRYQQASINVMGFSLYAYITSSVVYTSSSVV